MRHQNASWPWYCHCWLCVACPKENGQSHGRAESVAKEDLDQLRKLVSLSFLFEYSYCECLTYLLSYVCPKAARPAPGLQHQQYISSGVSMTGQMCRSSQGGVLGSLCRGCTLQPGCSARAAGNRETGGEPRSSHWGVTHAVARKEKERSRWRLGQGNGVLAAI